MKLCRFGTAVVNCDSDQNVFCVSLGVLDEYIEIAVVIENARVEEFVLKFFSRAAAVFLYQVTIGKFPLGILVEVLHVGMCGCAVEIEVVFLDVLAVVALAIGQAEEPLLQDRIPAIPKRDREAELLLVIGNSGQTIFSPAVGAGTRLVMTEVVPRIPVLAVVFAYCSPLPFAEIGSPFLPRGSVSRGQHSICVVRSVSTYAI